MFLRCWQRLLNNRGSNTVSAAQSRVFALTFIHYANFHITRKALSNVKPDLKESMGFSTFFLGDLDMMFLTSYAAGLFVAGNLSDRFDPKKLLIAGSLASATLTAMFGIGGVVGIKWEPYYGAVWLLNGVAQSFGWPCNVKIVGNWFGGDAHRGAVFGFWSACVSMGNIVGGLVGFVVLEIGLSWEAVFITSALLLMWATFAVAHFVASSPPLIVSATGEITPGRLALLRPRDLSDSSALQSLDGNVMMMMMKPSTAPLSATPTSTSTLAHAVPSSSSSSSSSLAAAAAAADVASPAMLTRALPARDARELDVKLIDDEDFDIDATSAAESLHRSQPISFLQAWCIPGVFVYALTNAFTKFVSYALFLWLPYFLHALGSSEAGADLLAVVFDIGGVIGGVAIGVLCDWALSRGAGRSLVIMPTLFFSAVTLSLWASARTKFVYVLLMLFAGVFSNSAYNLINSTIAADLGTHASLHGNARAVATVTGIVDGSGSLGAAIGQLVVGAVAGASGNNWVGVLEVLIVASLIAVVCLTPVGWRELQELRTRRTPLAPSDVRDLVREEIRIQ